MTRPASSRAEGGCVVLVVDDDRVVREVVRVVLEADDFDVVEAANGVEAMAAIERERPALVVLDVMMPGMDGIEFLLRRGGERREGEPRVLMLTARDDADTEEASQRAGADDFLAKPFSSVELLDRVERLLAQT
ncbi:MAG: response regulator transcription factor [Acidimicrobiales bacterium]